MLQIIKIIKSQNKYNSEGDSEGYQGSDGLSEFV